MIVSICMTRIEAVLNLSLVLVVNNDIPVKEVLQPYTDHQVSYIINKFVINFGGSIAQSCGVENHGINLEFGRTYKWYFHNNDCI